MPEYCKKCGAAKSCDDPKLHGTTGQNLQTDLKLQNVKIDVPDDLKDELPMLAQKIYTIAFNDAYKNNIGKTRRRTVESDEDVAHRMAWRAVKKFYYKGSDGQWHLFK